MTKDPYSVLGIGRDATEDEIKSAYRELAKKYHPDNYAGSPLADLAQEKMKEINEAYDEVQKLRKKKKSGYDDYGSESSGSYYSSSGSYSDSYSSDFQDVRDLIGQQNYYEADVRLNAVEAQKRNAEWHYLKGIVFQARGWYFEASRHFSSACEMDPHNSEYKTALENLKNTAAGYNRSEPSVCNVCSALLCADCCCEACGGDFIRCC